MTQQINPSNEYQEKVEAYLSKIAPGEGVWIDDIVADSNKKIFKAIVRGYMEKHPDQQVILSDDERVVYRHSLAGENEKYKNHPAVKYIMDSRILSHDSIKLQKETRYSEEELQELVNARVLSTPKTIKGFSYMISHTIFI